MRVHFVGNVANNHYVLAKAMRRHGIDARLFYCVDSPFHDLPEMEDPEIVRDRPEWLRPYPRQFQLWQQRDRVSRELLREISDCDIVHVHGVEIVWAARTGKPFIYHPYGGDFAAWTSYNSDTLIRWRPWPPVPIVPHFSLPLKMRWAMRHASAIAIGWHNNMWRLGYQVLRDLGLEARVVRIHLGLDVGKFSPLVPSEKDSVLARLLPEASLQRPIIFHPARQMFVDPNSKRGYKANDHLYRALGRYARDAGRFTLIVVDRGILDESSARRLIAELGIARHVIWVKMMARHELIQWYQAADVTADSFYTGAIGSVPLESMACGTPVMMHLQTEPSSEDHGIFYDPKELYPSLPPLITARTADEIYGVLRETVASSVRLAEFGRASRQWVTTYANADAVALQFVALYRTILAGKFGSRRLAQGRAATRAIPTMVF